MKTEFKTFSETLQKIAVQETKIELLMKWYDELRRARGGFRSRVEATLMANTSADALQPSSDRLPDPNRGRTLLPDLIVLIS
jgi:hypothetical protein